MYFAGLGEDERLLGHDRADDHLAGVHQASPPPRRRRAAPSARASRPAAPPRRRAARRRRSRRPRRRRSTGITSTRARLRNDLPAAASASVRSTSVGAAAAPVARSSAACLVDGASNGRGVEHGQRLALGVHRERAAQRRAARLAVDLDRVVARRGTERGAAAGPHRRARGAGAARPVPFWRHGLAPPPRTSPRVLVEAVPCRRALSSARTASCTSGMLNAASNATGSRSTVPPPSFGAVLAIGAHLHRAAAWARERRRAPAAGSAPGYLDHGQAALGDPAAAHPAGTADALEHPRGRGRGADRSRRADVVRAVRLGAAVEVVALDRALEALALGLPGDLDLVAGLERVDGHGLADQQLAGLVAELDQVAVGGRVGLLAGARARPWSATSPCRRRTRAGPPRSRRARRSGSRSPGRAGLEHGHALDAAVLEEPLRHAELPARIAAIRASRGQADLDVHAGREMVEPLERVDRLRASAGGCRSVACGCGSRSARASPCP